MKLKAKSLLSIFLILALFLSIAPDVFASTASAAFARTDTVQKGDWIGSYGASGYYLPFYLVRETYGVTSGRYATLLDPESAGASSYAMPSYVTAFSSSSAGNGYYVDSNITYASTTDLRALTNPGNLQTRYKTLVRSGNNLTFKFTLNDQAEHLFTVYATTYASTRLTSVTYQILDKNAVVLAQYTPSPSELDNGIYMTFRVKGEFSLRAVKNSGNYALLSGMFFDEVPENTLSDFNAQYQVPRSVNLTWSNSGTGGVGVQRKLSTGEEWKDVAFVENGTNTYTDTNLDTGVTYDYRVYRLAGALPSVAAAAVSVAIPSYEATVLAFDTQEYIAAGPGEETVFNLSLTNSQAEPVAGKSIRLSLTGDWVGEFVEGDLGTVVTDESGLASLSYTAAIAGNYELNAAFDADDTDLLSACTTSASFTVNTEPWTQAPFILNASDAIGGGEHFSVRGYGMNLGDIEIKMLPADGTDSLGAPPPEAVSVAIVQMDEENGFFVVGTLPDTWDGGLYSVWVGNQYGWSNPFILNKARLLFISENSAWEGQTIELSGRNLLSSQFGGDSETRVRLKSAPNTFEQAIIKNTEYSLSFSVEAPVGAYTVEASNDGIHWDELLNGQTLTVVEEGQDPLGLGVAWADDFNWNTQVNVLDYGAAGNDAASDTQAVANAIAAVKALGGGVVYFPAGNYFVSSIALPAHVVLLGESTELTRLYYTGSGENFIYSSGDGKTVGCQGAARMTIELADSDLRPGSFFWLGHDWGGNTLEQMSARTNSRYFLYEVNIGYPVDDPGTTGLGNGVTTIIGDHFLMEKCSLVGYKASINTGYIRSYASVRDNDIEYASGYFACWAQYTFMENNRVYIHDETEAASHGYDTRGNSHLENNYINGAGGGTTNDGESYFVEMPGMVYDYGKVVSASEKTLVLKGQGTFSTSYNNRNGHIILMLVDGKGVGQYRYVQSWNGNTFLVTKDWDILPDATSKFTLISSMDNVTFYRNIAENSKEGFLFYGNVIDGVAANNISINTKGVYVYTSHVKSQSRFTPGYFITVKDNLIYGVSKLYNNGGIYVTSQRSGVGGQYVAVAAYGIDVRNNRIIGDLAAVPAANEPPSGIALYSSMKSSDGGLTNEAGDITNVIIQNNTIESVVNAIYLTSGNYGVVLSGNDIGDSENSYINGTQAVGRYPINVTDLNGISFADKGIPWWKALAELQVTVFDEGVEFRLDWDAASDNVGITAYRILVNGESVGTVDGNTTGFTWQPQVPNGSYSFGVQAGDSAGNWSSHILEWDWEAPAQP